jgi:putative ABC transport system permease protein
VNFRVIGVSVAKGDQLINTGMPDDLLVIVPYTAAQRWFSQSDRVPELILSPVERERGWESIRQARQLLALHHDFDPDLETAVWAFNVYDVLKMLYGMMGALRFFLISAGVITLLVGAVGVMNIMLVVVGERVNEIGLRKAVGASSRAIFVQFLAEAVAVCGLSGVSGAAIGVATTQLLARAMPAENPLASPPILDPLTVAAIALSLAFVGVIAGVVPARRAARIPPAEALRAT